eukprot:RCo017922
MAAVNPTVAALRRRSLHSVEHGSAMDLLTSSQSLVQGLNGESSENLNSLVLASALGDSVPHLELQETPLEGLPELLRSHGISVADKEVFDLVDTLRARGALRGEGIAEGVLSPADIRAVLADIHLHGAEYSSVPIGHATTPQRFSGAGCCGGLVSRLRGWYFHIRGRLRGTAQPGTEVYESAVKPSNRLLLTVVAISLLIALSVGGLAVGLNWTNSMSARKAELGQQMKSIQGAADFFSLRMAQLETEKGLETSATIVAKFLS